MAKQVLSDLDLNTQARVINLPTPTLGHHAVNKLYVDTLNGVPTSLASGTATIDFGSTPTDNATIVVSGLAGLSAGNYIKAYIQTNDSTTDNTANDHRLLGFWSSVNAEYTSSTSITINCNLLIGLARGQFKIRYIIDSVGTKGTATINFGSTPTDSTSLLVTGFSGLLATNNIQVFVQTNDSTTDNTANDHKLLNYWGKVYAEYTSATSITINCRLLIGLARGQFKIRYIIST